MTDPKDILLRRVQEMLETASFRELAVIKTSLLVNEGWSRLTIAFMNAEGEPGEIALEARSAEVYDLSTATHRESGA